MKVVQLFSLLSILGSSLGTNTTAPTGSPTITCKDSDDYTFTLDIGTEVGCDWLTKFPQKTLTRKSKYCHRATVKFSCPASCQSCDAAVACDDDATYTFTLEKAGTDVGCSWITNNQFSKEVRKANYCDDVGMSCPRSCGYCIKYPGGSPTKTPTTSPTGSPTVTPGTPTASPTTASPTVSPTTSAPTVPQPTPAPTTANPAVCGDDATFTFPLNFDPSIMQNCNWLTKNIAKSSARRATYCPVTEIEEACKLTCGQCD